LGSLPKPPRRIGHIRRLLTVLTPTEHHNSCSHCTVALWHVAIESDRGERVFVGGSFRWRVSSSPLGMGGVLEIARGGHPSFTRVSTSF